MSESVYFELGATLLLPDRTPAGVKRISRLLYSPKWAAELIGRFLFRMPISWRQSVSHMERVLYHVQLSREGRGTPYIPAKWRFPFGTPLV